MYKILELPQFSRNQLIEYKSKEIIDYLFNKNLEQLQTNCRIARGTK